MSRDEATQQRQLDIVLNLNRLTKHGRLSWERKPKMPKGGDTGLGVVYEAYWKGHRVIIEEVPTSWSTLGRQRRSSSDGAHLLRVRKRRGGEDDIVIPPMSAIDDLVDTIQRKNDGIDRSAGDIETLESFNRLLEEDL